MTTVLSISKDCVYDLKVRNVPVDVTSVRLRIALYTNETSTVPFHHVHKV